MSKLLKLLIILVVAVLVILVVLQAFLSPRFCTSTVTRYASEFVDGDLAVGRVSVSLFRRFPAVSAQIDSLLVTYPAGRFGSHGARGVDTLAYIGHLSASVNVLSLLRGKIDVKEVELFRPRINLHFYDGARSNLDIFKLSFSGDDSQCDSGVVVLPPILVRRVCLDQRAALRYVSDKDSLAAMLLVKDFIFDGRLHLDDPNACVFTSRLDSLLLFGRKGRDTLMFDLDHFNVDVSSRTAALNADAKLYAATKSLGRLKIPVHVDGSVGYDIPRMSGPYRLECRGTSVDVASLSTDVNMSVAISDSIEVDGSVTIDNFNLAEFSREYLERYLPELSEIRTDAVLSAKAVAKGCYKPSTGSFPAVDLDVRLPRFSVSPKDGSLGTALTAETFASVTDALGSDPLIKLDADFSTNLDVADRMFGGQLGMKLSGALKADAVGQFRLSELSSLILKKGKIDASLEVSDLSVRTEDDSLDVYVHNLSARAAMSSRVGQDSGVTLNAGFDSLRLEYANAALIAGKEFRLKASASATPVVVSDSLSYHPLIVSADIASVRMIGTDSLAFSLKNSSNLFSVHPPFEKGKDGKFIRSESTNPVINVISRNAVILARMGANRIFARNLDFNGRTSLNPVTHNHPRRGGKRPVMDWMTERDFIRADLSFDMGKNFKDYLEKWDIRGKISMGSGGLASMYFPLRTRIDAFNGEFTNNCLTLDSLVVRSGESHIRASGKIDNIKRAVFYKMPLEFNLDLRTDSLDVNELATAYSKGQANRNRNMSYLSDAEFEQVEQTFSSAPDSTDDAVSRALVVLPSNVNACMTLKGSGVKYSTMDISSLSASMKLSRRCLLMEGFSATTNMGSLRADAFYSTKTKKDLCAGFDLDMSDISAEQIIGLVPAVDTLFPLLKSFSGKLNCTLAAASSIDTCMNLVLPSIDGVIRISGSSLGFKDNPDIAKVARLLLFKRPDNAFVNEMMVEGILKNGTLEIFPFILKIDRWQMALAGLQDIGKSFNYHVSVINSPLPFRLGINVSGSDFDNFKVKMGKPRFKTAGSIPVFTRQIDSTRINLVESISNILQTGAEKAIRNFKNTDAVDSVRRERGYARSAALENLEQTSIEQELMSAAPGKEN